MQHRHWGCSRQLTSGAFMACTGDKAGTGVMKSTWCKCSKGHCKDRLDVLDNRCARRLDHDTGHVMAGMLFVCAKHPFARHQKCPPSPRRGAAVERSSQRWCNTCGTSIERVSCETVVKLSRSTTPTFQTALALRGSSAEYLDRFLTSCSTARCPPATP